MTAHGIVDRLLVDATLTHVEARTLDLLPPSQFGTLSQMLLKCFSVAGW